MVSNKSSSSTSSSHVSKRFKKPNIDDYEDWVLYKELFKIEQPQAIDRSSKEDMESYVAICDKISDQLYEINKIKLEENEDENKELLEQKRTYICNLLILLKKINRLDKFRMSHNREKLLEKCKKVDSVHLQLQNLLYEEEYLKKEISKCNQIQSDANDIDLISIDEFYQNAPESISKPDVTKNDDHQLQLSRLEWELEQRKNLTNKLDELNAEIDEINQVITEKKKYLDGFNPLIQDLATIAAPLIDYLGDTHDPSLEQCPKLTLLPHPLFVLFSETEAYCRAYEKKIELKVIGNEDKALQLKEVQKLDYTDDSDLELEIEFEQDANDEMTDYDEEKKSRHHNKGHKQEDQRKRILESHPLSVQMNFESKLFPGSILLLVFNYKTLLHIVTVTATVHLGSNISNGICSADIISPENILKDLFPNDDGLTSPNPTTKYLLRRLGMDSLESLVVDFGIPYIWVQRLCGLNFNTNKFVNALPKMSDATDENHLEQVMKALINRFESKLALSMQIQALESRTIPTVTMYSTLNIQSSIMFWKYITWEEYCSSGITKDFIENQLVSENDLLYQMAVIKLGAKLLAYVSIKNGYPKQIPIFSLKVNFNEEFNAKNSDAIRDIERSINTNSQKDFYQKNEYFNLLALQVTKLLYYFELFLEIQYPNEFLSDKPIAKKLRGRTRSFPFKMPDLIKESISNQKAE